MRAVTYARISTESQSETSLSEQTRRAKQYAATYEHEVIESYEDTGTGTKTDREGFQKLMDTIDDWDIVIAYKLDRFHRSSSNALAWATELDSLGKNFVAMDIDVDTSTAMGMAIFKIITALNQMEVEVTRERTIMGIQGVKNEGRWVGKPPYGYDSKFAQTKDEKDKGILTINPEEADIVKSIFDFKSTGDTNSEITDRLITNGILTRTGKRNWASATIAGILDNKGFYEGSYLDADNLVQEYSWEAIL
jgi:site-specific DNA recombinase